MTIGAFAIIVVMEREGRGGEELNDYAGLSVSRPFLAGAMAVFMFSLAGIPPLGIAVLNSVIAAFYYLRVIYVMYMQEEKERVKEPGYEAGVLLNSVLIISLIMIFLTGLAPSRFLEIILLTFRRFV